MSPAWIMASGTSCTAVEVLGPVRDGGPLSSVSHFSRSALETRYGCYEPLGVVEVPGVVAPR